MRNILKIVRRVLLGPPHRSTMDMTMDSFYEAISNINTMEQAQQVHLSDSSDAPEETINMTNIVMPRK